MEFKFLIQTVHFQTVNFVDFSGLPDERAKELFEVLYPEQKYSKTETPWRLISRVITCPESPKKLSAASTNQINNGSPFVAQPSPDHRIPFPGNITVPPIQLQHSSPIVSAPLIVESHMPPAPFQSTGVSSQRPLPHNNISQFTQQQRMAFYSRTPPFPVVPSNYSLPHGQEILAMHHGYPSGEYEMCQPNEPPPGMPHMHQPHKYRNEKMYIPRKPKKNFYDNSYASEEMCMGLVDSDPMNAQQLGQPMVQFSSNHYPGGMSTAQGYPAMGQYIHPSAYLSYVPYQGYIQQQGHLGTMGHLEMGSPEVMPYEPPSMVNHPPPPSATVPCVIMPELPVVCQPPPPSSPLPVVMERQEVEPVKEEPLLEAEPEEVKTEVQENIYESDKEIEAEEPRPDSSSSATNESPVRTPEPLAFAEKKPDTSAQEGFVPKLEPVPVTSASVPSGGTTSAWGKPKSWAGVFGNPGGPTAEALGNDAKDSVAATVQEEDDAATDDGENDILVPKLAKFMQRYHLDFTTRPVQPRGLVNRSNWCYINATLQALLACPALFNMLKQLQEIVRHRPNSCTPITDSLVDLVSEFTPTAFITKRKEDLVIGPPLEPACIYKMLTLIKSECIKGRQEDAEEFLSCILNGLHEEMVALSKASATNNGTCNGGIQTNGRLDLSEGDEEEEEEEEDKDENHWKVMGAKNKGMVTRSDQASTGSLVKNLFGGQTRSVLTAAGSDCSAVLQPFFTLQLDIQAEGESVCDSLSHQLSAKEAIQGYQCPKSKREVEAHRRTTLEEIPPVLILHYKRFVYDDKDGGSKKVLKRTEYSLDLEIKKDFLSLEVKNKYGAKASRSYKLFAVVYHDGKEAVKGHYIADIFYPACGIWLRCDDRNVTPVTEAQVQSFNAPCVPYLLFYERTDVQPSK